MKKYLSAQREIEPSNYAATKNKGAKTNKYTRRLRYITNTRGTLPKLTNTKN